MKLKSKTTLQSFGPKESPKLFLALLVIGLAVLLAVTANVAVNPALRKWSFYLSILCVGIVGLLAVPTLKLILSKYLVPSWSGKWDVAILGKYLNLNELIAITRLVASGRWEFDAVPSVSKTGITIELKGNAVSDSDLASLARLRTVHLVVLADCNVTDAGLSQLARIDSLECLVLSRTSVTDAGLVHLKAIPQLKTLDVDGTAVSDSALQAAGLLDKKFSLAAVEKAAHEARISAPSAADSVWLEIVEMNQRLAAMRPDACTPDLAISLNNLGWGKRSLQALADLQESVAINRRLVATQSDKHRSALYNSLANLGGVLTQLERYEEALVATREAVDVYQQIPSTEPSTDLALNLHRLGSLYSKLDRHEEAVQATRESVEMYRLRVAMLPTAWMLHSWFVSSLNDLSKQLNLLARSEDALAAAEEAVEVSRRSTGNPSGSKDLTTSLNNLGKILTDLGRSEEALAATQEAADLQR